MTGAQFREVDPPAVVRRWTRSNTAPHRPPRPASLRLPALAVMAPVVVWLAVAVSVDGGISTVDVAVWRWLTGHRTTPLTAAAVIVTQTGSTAALGAMALTAVVWLVLRSHRADAVLVAITAVGTGLLITGSKTLIARSRPPEHLQLVLETAPSFPSGHALGSVAVLGVLGSVFIPRCRSTGWRATIRVGLTLVVVVVGCSRLYLGVHWLTDVAAGWLVGAGWWSSCAAGRRSWARRRAGNVTDGAGTVAPVVPEVVRAEVRDATGSG